MRTSSYHRYARISVKTVFISPFLWAFMQSTRSLAQFPTSIVATETSTLSSLSVWASTSPSSFAGAFGFGPVIQDIGSTDANIRASAVLRAVELNTEDSWALVEAAAADFVGTDPNGSLWVRQIAARALMRSPHREKALEALRVLLKEPTPRAHHAWVRPSYPFLPIMPYVFRPYSPEHRTKPTTEKVEWVRSVAAMALMQMGDWKTLFGRVRSLDIPEASRAASQALLAAPTWPALQSFLPLGPEFSPQEMEVLKIVSTKGDLRAAEYMVRLAQSSNLDVVRIAMSALSRMGDERVLELARSLNEKENVRARVVAAEALCEMKSTKAREIIHQLMSEPTVQEYIRTLVLKCPSSSFLPQLERMAREGDADAIAAMGRIGAPALSSLIALIRDKTLFDNGVASQAMYTLALMPESSAEIALLQSARSSNAREQRFALRAAALRFAYLRKIHADFQKIAESFRSSNVDADRWVSALLLSALDINIATQNLRHTDSLQREAAAVALAAHPTEIASKIARSYLEQETSFVNNATFIQTLSWLVLRDYENFANQGIPIPNTVLQAWFHENTSASPLAALILMARSDTTSASLQNQALHNENEAVQVAALLGLGLSKEPSATGILLDQLRDWLPASLRRAVVRALGVRPERTSHAVRNVLLDLQQCDPDLEVRSLASQVLSNVHGSRPLFMQGREVLQVHVQHSGVKQQEITAALSIDSLWVPQLLDPDGFIVSFQLPAGHVQSEVRPQKFKNVNQK